MLVWLNGHFLRAQDARISALDRGLLHGDGVYDTWRAYSARSFALGAHLRRLRHAAHVLDLPSPEAEAIWARRCRLLLRRNHLFDATLRLTITRGTTGVGLDPEGRTRPTLLLHARPLPSDLAKRQRDGIGVVLLPFPRDAGPAWGSLKLLGHVSAVRGRQLATRRKAHDGLYVTSAGDVTEATGANLFIVEHDRIVTPPERMGILAGVTRAIVLRLARRARLEGREEPISVARLRRAHEVFLTASTVEILPVVRIETRLVRRGASGPITRLLQGHYTAHVRATLARQRR